MASFGALLSGESGEAEQSPKGFAVKHDRLKVGLGLGVGMALAVSVVQPVQAHPHIWIEARSTVLYDAKARVSALKLHWTFDELYTAFATDGLDRDGDGTPDQAELTALAAVNLASLQQFDFFTQINVNDRPVPFAQVSQFTSAMEGGRLTMSFTLPLAAPIDPRQDQFSYLVFDPSYYTEILHKDAQSIAQAGSAVPPACETALIEPNPDPAMTLYAASLDATEDGGDDLGIHFAQRIALHCGEAHAP